MRFELLGWPDDGVTLRLDHERFAYAGKFVMSSTGKAVAVEGDTVSAFPDAREGYAEGVLAAVAFNEDRTDPDTLWLRYVTVRADRRGEGIGSRFVAFVTRRAHEAGYERVRIAVNNPYSYEALSKAGFGFSGRETGIAELVMEHPSDGARYREGLARFADRDLSPEEKRFVAERTERGPPPRPGDDSPPDGDRRGS
ncbi:GNAT family N-acetyltransferase [Halomarina litorea]|uniref:GNAT family N-acetyltransferase n=1 Tax=Halomarina litorea TaxID=2961595 RepID=UPI0020C29FD9|nr:GNAT family N-acetyltransferase [Halomarina sp. BCD28]